MKPSYQFIALVTLFLLLASTSAGAKTSVIEGPISGQVLSVIDGDTLNVKINVWLDQQIEVNLRILGIDTPEIHGKCAFEKRKAEEARQEIIKLVNDDKIKVFNIRHDKYARRVLAQIENYQGINIASHMIEKGLARPYNGEKRQGWCS